MSINITVSARSTPNTYVILGVLSDSIPGKPLRGVNVSRMKSEQFFEVCEYLKLI